MNTQTRDGLRESGPAGGDIDAGGPAGGDPVAPFEYVACGAGTTRP